MCEVNRDHPIYDKVLPITLLQNLKEDRVLLLTFRILNGQRNVNISGHIEKVIHFEVTDENDPCFLYLLDIGENDFHYLKRDQAILVEFSIFPLKFIELIDLCLSSSINNNKISTSTNLDNISIFTAKLDVNSGILSIVESNKFKQLTHISLELHQGNDNDIKSYLASRLFMASSLSRHQALQLNTYEQELVVERNLRRDMAKELQELRSHKDIQVESLQSNHLQELSQLQRQHMELIEELRRKIEYQQESSRNELNSLQSNYQSKLKSLEELNSELINSNKQLEFKIKDLNRQLDSAETDRDRLLTDLTDMTNQRRISEDSRVQLDREVVRLEAKLDGLKQQLLNKDESINKTMALYKSNEESKAILEQQLQLYLNTIDSLNEKLQGGTNEIQRGNNVISKYQQENKQLKEKIKIKSEVIRRQESFVNQLKDKINELDKFIIELKNDKVLLNNKNNQLQQQLDENVDNLKKCQENLFSNEKVIEFLNEENNKWQLGWTGNNINNIQSGNNQSTAASNNQSNSYNNNTSTSRTVSNHNYQHEFNPKVMSVSPDSVINKAVFKSPNVVSSTYTPTNLNDNELYMKGIQKLGINNLMTNDHYDIGTDLSKLDYYATAEAINPIKQSYNHINEDNSQRYVKITPSDKKDDAINNLPQRIYEWE